MTTRRNFIKSAIATAVSAVLPGLGLATVGRISLPPNHVLEYYVRQSHEDQWHHYVIKREGGVELDRMFIDGKEVTDGKIPLLVTSVIDDPCVHIGDMRLINKKLIPKLI